MSTHANADLYVLVVDIGNLEVYLNFVFSKLISIWSNLSMGHCLNLGWIYWQSFFDLVIVNFTRIGGMQELLKRYNLYLNTLLFIYNISILLLRLFVT